MGEALVALRDYEAVHEALMLQTCGRLEIYAEVESYEAGLAQLRLFLKSFRHGGVEDMDDFMYTLLGSQAVDHLLRVSTGLDSMLIGEAEILGQVKDAFIEAQRANSVGKTLHALLRQALAAGKAARSQTAIGRRSTSIATAAVAFAREHVGSLGGSNVLVVGAGKMGSLAARRLKHDGAGEIVVLNRSRQRARDVVASIGTGRAGELPELGEALRRADVVITSTGAEHFVLTRENVAAAMAARPERPLVIVDIAVPRDADPEIASLANVRVVDVDGLKDAVDVTLEQRRAAIPLVEEIIAEHAARFAQWYDTRVALPVISSLVQRAEELRDTELQRLFARCPELGDREKMLITGMSMTIVSKLLHNAIAKIRDTAASDVDEALSHAAVLHELFGLRKG